MESPAYVLKEKSKKKKAKAGVSSSSSGLDSSNSSDETQTKVETQSEQKRPLKKRILTQDDIHIDPAYEALVPRPSQEEYEALELSIEKDGQRDLIDVNEAGVVLDGHTRFHILRKLDRKIKFRVRIFKSKEDEERFVREAAALRRNMSPIKKIRMLEPELRREREKVQARQKLGKRITSVSDDTEVGDVYTIVAGRYGIGRATLARGIHVLEHATPEQFARLENNEATINGLYNLMKKKESGRKPKPNPKDLDHTKELSDNSARENKEKTEATKTGEKQSTSSPPAGTRSSDESTLCDRCGGSFPSTELKGVELCRDCFSNAIAHR
jgi:hypothetical protein